MPPSLTAPADVLPPRLSHRSLPFRRLGRLQPEHSKNTGAAGELSDGARWPLDAVSRAQRRVMRLLLGIDGLGSLDGAELHAERPSDGHHTGVIGAELGGELGELGRHRIRRAARGWRRLDATTPIGLI